MRAKKPCVVQIQPGVWRVLFLYTISPSIPMHYHAACFTDWISAVSHANFLGTVFADAELVQ